MPTHTHARARARGSEYVGSESILLKCELQRCGLSYYIVTHAYQGSDSQAHSSASSPYLRRSALSTMASWMALVTSRDIDACVLLLLLLLLLLLRLLHAAAGAAGAVLLLQWLLLLLLLLRWLLRLLGCCCGGGICA